MKKRYIFICVLVLVLVIAGLIIALKGGNSAVDDVSTNVPTQEITEKNDAPESNPTSVPTENPTFVPINDSEGATPEPTPTTTPKVDEDAEVIPTAPIVSDDEDDDKNDTTNKNDVPNFDDGEEATPNPTPQISEAPKASPTPIVEDENKVTPSVAPTPTTKVEPTKVPTPSVAPTSTPKVEPTSTPTPTKAPSIGSDSGSTIELPSLGISIPKRDNFNSEALVDDKNSAWYGDVDDTKSGQALLDTLDKVTNALLEKRKISTADQSFLFQDNVITFDWYQYSGSGDFMLFRNTSEGYYELSINVPLDYYESYLNVDVTQANHEVLKTMLSVVSSTPNEVFDYLYRGIVLDGSIITAKSYTSIGDCAIRWDNDNSYIYDGGYSLIFEIKPN